jgi:hypothetical protein
MDGKLLRRLKAWPRSFRDRHDTCINRFQVNSKRWNTEPIVVIDEQERELNSVTQIFL